MTFEYIEKYNELWLDKKITKPIVILIGGYAGTAKSTVAKEILKHINFLQIIPTGFIRSIEQKYTQTNPAMFENTFNLHKLGNVEENFLAQAEPISETINYCIDFLAKEKQHCIIDGNHVLPSTTRSLKEVILLEFYMKTTDAITHRKMLCGPTHSREINDLQFETGRKIQELILKLAKLNQKTVFEYDTEYSKILEFINQEIKKQLL